ncbi:MAG: hypothetical protein Q7S11_02740, partial [bacterium]|nr:hypothetical protein [bacterium]
PLRGGGGWGEETREKCKEIFWFLHTRVRERVRGAFLRFTTQSERTIQFQATTRSARAKWVRAKANTSPFEPAYRQVGFVKLGIPTLILCPICGTIRNIEYKNPNIFDHCAHCKNVECFH